MTLPYQWNPTGVVFGGDPVVGDLFPHEHAVFRITEVSEPRLNPDGHRVVPIRFAPVPADPDPTTIDRTAQLGPHWRKYPDGHYPVCAHCGEPVPCRAKVAEHSARRAAAVAARYDREGFCPACEEPVTARQKSMHYPDNVVVPFGPPITFHWRAKCRPWAAEYDEAWARVLQRPPLLSCPGRAVTHLTVYECSQQTECPGPWAAHAMVERCDCRPPGGIPNSMPVVQEITRPEGPLRVTHERLTVAPSVAALAPAEGGGTE